MNSVWRVSSLVWQVSLSRVTSLSRRSASNLSIFSCSSSFDRCSF